MMESLNVLFACCDSLIDVEKLFHVGTELLCIFSSLPLFTLTSFCNIFARMHLNQFVVCFNVLLFY